MVIEKPAKEFKRSLESKQTHLLESIKNKEKSKMRILAVIQGNYGKRIVNNILSHAPQDWKISTWIAPSRFPVIIEEPEEFLPQSLPQVDLLISLGENPGVAEITPGLAKLSKAKAVIAPCDNRDWLPTGLKNQIKKELESSGISCVFPVPFCSLTEKFSENEYIKSFARYFGKLNLTLICNQGKINKIIIKREAPCGCSRFVTEKLIGVKLEKAEEKAGLFHHYYPCLASGKINGRFKDSLLHQSANITKLAVKEAIKENLDNLIEKW